MKKEIHNLLYSALPEESIDRYINKKMVKRDQIWFLFSLGLSFLFLSIMYSNRITRQDILKAARPLVDSMQVKYQNQVHFIQDSLTTDFNNRKGGRHGK